MTPTIVLTKEGNILSVEVLNFEANCCTKDLYVKSDISGGSNGEPCSVSISVVPDDMWACDCICPFNVSFTVRDLEPNSFYFDCWWYKGQVELTEGEPLVLEYKAENANIGDMSFRLLKVMHKAMLMDWVTAEDELHIPSEVTYEGETYNVTSISKDAFWNTENATRITIPKSIRSMDPDHDAAIYANPFRECKSLKWIEVEEGCPLFSSVDGVLFAENKTMLLGYPIASSKETYTVPEGVTNIRSGAFYHNKYLRKLVIPDGVTYLGWHLFSDTNSLEALYIKGVLEPECMSTLFDNMDTKVVVYVKPSEVEKFKAVYKGSVYPLPDQTVDDIAYRPFVEDWKVWKVGTASGNPVQVVDYYYFDGDTIIDGKTCKQMMCQRVVSPDYANEYWTPTPSVTKVGAWYEEDKQVYFYGSIDGPTISPCNPIMGDPVPEFQMSCTVGDEVIYLNDEYEDGATPAEARKKRFDFTHTIKIRPKAPIKQETSDACISSSEREVSRPKVKAPSRSDEQLSLYGEYNDQQLGIHLEPLDEAYQVSIADESGKVVYEKAVNAGNIVGLSIDISAYAKCHYTVTVENSSEAFTGEFEAQTTGIEENVKIEKCKNVSIYNLQGQRLSSLQKGLNIVNGRKISVK